MSESGEERDADALKDQTDEQSATAGYELEQPVEIRPTSDFVDGFLAGLALTNALLADGGRTTFYFSFEWIGDGEEDRNQALHMALHSEPETMAFDCQKLEDWRDHAEALGRKWLARHFPPQNADRVVTEFMEVLNAFVGDDAAEIYHVAPRAPDGDADMTPAIGGAYDHLLFEVPAGRILMELCVEG